MYTVQYIYSAVYTVQNIYSAERIQCSTYVYSPVCIQCSIYLNAIQYITYTTQSTLTSYVTYCTMHTFSAQFQQYISGELVEYPDIQLVNISIPYIGRLAAAGSSLFLVILELSSSSNLQQVSVLAPDDLEGVPISVGSYSVLPPLSGGTILVPSGRPLCVHCCLYHRDGGRGGGGEYRWGGGTGGYIVVHEIACRPLFYQ